MGALPLTRLIWRSILKAVVCAAGDFGLTGDLEIDYLDAELDIQLVVDGVAGC